jgi:toxin YoeB
MRKIWNDRAWGDYLHWQKHDKTKVKRINELLKAIERDPFKGIGEPEPLKYNLKGWWSREVDKEHRLVYRIVDGMIEINQCKDHY